MNDELTPETVIDLPRAARRSHRIIPAEAEIETLIRARYPLINVISWEEERVMRCLDEIGERCQKKLMQWTVNAGLGRVRSGIKGAPEGKKGTKDPILVLPEIEKARDEPSIFVLKDFHRFFNQVGVVRGLRDLATSLRDTFSTIVILSPALVMVPELEKEMTVVDFPLPDRDELNGLLDEIAEDLKNNSSLQIDTGEESRRRLLDASIGLTLHEAENVFAKILLRRGRLSASEAVDVYEEKQQIVRKSGLLEYIHTEEQMENIGGLELLKEWLVRRRGAFHPAARDFGLPIPKGLLLTGVQGCGKSLAAKAVSRFWQMPLLRMDMGRMFGSLVGSSEQNVRQAIKLAEAIAPAVLWIDEIDKGFAGLKNSVEGDSGTASRVFATLITWMQEKKAPVFVIATANNVERLPPELLRQGRFDEIFFIDLPTKAEREQIFRIHLRKRLAKFYEDHVKEKGRFASLEDFVERAFNIAELATAAEKEGPDEEPVWKGRGADEKRPASQERRARSVFSGAEIEQSIIAALYNAYFERKMLSQSMILDALRETSPLSKVMASDIAARRDWARERTRRASLADGT